MKQILIFSLCVIATTFADKSAAPNPQVTAPVGKISGSILKSRLGKDIYSFRGIRYGLAPVGKRRFQVATPVPDWNNVLDASMEGPGCIQMNGKNMSEDCLRLNVYTTKLPSKNEQVCRPVVVFIHPGGFYSWSGQSNFIGPQYLLDKDVVLVSINYRLGALGFISTGDSAAPGNVGFKDQVVALRWVQRNIAAFGGDPNSVTLMGCSAGSFSVTLHMMSPMSRNLFHRGVAMSGSTIGSDTNIIVPHHQIDLAKRQAKLLECPTDTNTAMMDCLGTKPEQDYIDTMDKLFDWYGYPTLLWKPVIEPEVDGIERFLPDHPVNLIRQGNFYQVPLIAGLTKDEFGPISSYFQLQALSGNDSLYREIDEGWDRLAPLIFLTQTGTNRTKYITDEIRKSYFGDKPINMDTYKELGDVLRDGVIKFPVYRETKFVARHSKESVYFYEFTQKGRYSFYMWNETTPYGVGHQDDLQYLFFMENFFPFVEKDAPESPMIDLYTSIFANFAKNGEPIPKDNERLKNIQWPTVHSAPFKYLEINLNPTVKTGFYDEKMAVWDRLYPLPAVAGLSY